MAEKMVVSGIPGSGKSAIANHIIEYVSSYPYSLRAIHMSDYAILYQKFLDEEALKLPKSDRRLYPVEHGGFYVSDPAVYDEALTELSGNIRARSTQEIDLVIVEFARSNFLHALQLLGNDFLSDSSFIFLNTNIDTCKERVCKRIEREFPPRTLNDHYVSEYTFEFYIGQDNIRYWENLRSNLKSKYSMEPSKIEIVPNNDSWFDAVKHTNLSVDRLLAPHLLITSPSR